MRNVWFGPSIARALRRSVCGCAAVWSLSASSMAAAPPGHFEIVGDTVEDTATKLTWQRYVSARSYTLKDAASYCADLSLEGSGWRLPSVKELQTLVDESRSRPAIDREVFPDTPPTFFWSSSNVASFSMYAWTVNFADGTDLWFPLEHELQVRCVR